ncbi:MAG: DUF1194 domain-containing protein [Kiloniellales bacterium]
MQRPARLVILVLTLALACVPRLAAAQTTVDLQLVLAIDVSGSVDGVEGALQRQGYIDAFKDPTVISAIAAGQLGRIGVTYFEWAHDGYTTTIVDWMLLGGAADAKELATKLEQTPFTSARWTSISGAIDYGVGRLAVSPFAGGRKVIDISGDGYNNRGRPVNMARDEAVAAGITINGLPIVNNRPSSWGGPPAIDLDIYYETSVIGGPGAFVIVAQSFEDFATAIRAKLIREIAGAGHPAGKQLAGQQ